MSKKNKKPDLVKLLEKEIKKISKNLDKNNGKKSGKKSGKKDFKNNKDEKIPNKLNKNPQKPLISLLMISLVISAGYTIFGDNLLQNYNKIPEKEISLSKMQEEYNSGKLEKIIVDKTKISAKLKVSEVSDDEVNTENNGNKVFSYKLENENINDLGFNNPEIETEVKVANTESEGFWRELLLSLIPIIVIFVILSFVMRNSMKGLEGRMGFGNNKAKKFDKKNGLKTKFEDVAGCDESKAELVEVVDFLKYPKKYVKMGAKIPKGILLVGSPGTGKTLLAKAVAGEAGVPFFSISGSEFVEMFVGVGASRVRDLFKDAKECKTAIIFIDEIDAIGKQRGGGMGGGHDEREQTLNQILTEMDGFEAQHNVIVLAATNRPEILDKALLRPGRFDRQVVIDKPDLKARIDILNVHAKGKKLAKDTDLEEIAKKTPGFTGAELANILNEAAILAARFKKKFIEQPELLEAVEKVMMGPEKKSSILTDKEKEITAYHEIGHALTSYFMPGTDPVHKISIIPRGMSLGSTWYLPETETRLYTETKFAGELTSLYGGHLAEKIKFGEVSTGASNDIERATKMARSMVTQYGMSSLGAIQWESRDGGAYTGGDAGITKNHSNEFAKKIDEEVVKILDFHYKNAEKILRDHMDIFEELSKRLYEKETITAKEFNEYLERKGFKKS